MKQPLPLTIFDRIYNSADINNSKKLFIEYSNIDDLHTKIFGKLQTNIQQSFKDDISKYTYTDNEKKKILIHILIKLLYNHYIISSNVNLQLNNDFKDSVTNYVNVISKSVNEFIGEDQRQTAMDSNINIFNNNKKENSNIYLGIKIRKSAKDKNGTTWSKNNDINPRVQISTKDEKFTGYNTSLKIKWNDTPNKIELKIDKNNGAFKSGDSKEDEFDKYYFQGADNIWGDDANSETIAENIKESENQEEENIMVIMGVGQSGSGKTYTLFGPNESNNTNEEGTIIKLLKKYNPQTISVLIGEIYEKSSDNYINYIDEQETKLETKFRYINKNKIFNSIVNKIKNAENVDSPAIFEKNQQSSVWELNNVELSKYLLEALKIRTIQPTPNNAESSRSHVIMCIKFDEKTIFVIDAAGVENKFKCDSPDFTDRYNKKLKSAMGELKYMNGKYPNMRQAFASYPKDYENNKNTEKNEDLNELNNEFFNNKKNKKNITTLAKNNNIKCTIPDEKLNVNVYNYVKEDRDYLKEKISVLFADIFRFNDENFIFEPRPPSKAEITNDARAPHMNKKKITTMRINYSDDNLPSFNDLNFRDITSSKNRQIQAKKWLKKKIDNKNKQAQGNEGKVEEAINVLQPFLEPHNIELQQTANQVRKSGGKPYTYLGNPFFYNTVANEKLDFKLSAIELFIEFLNEDLKENELVVEINDYNKKVIGQNLRKAILGIKSRPNEIYSTEGVGDKYFINSGGPIDNFWYKLNNDSLKLIEEINKIFWGELGGSKAILKIIPELTEKEKCEENKKKYTKENCEKALVKQGYMINTTLAEFSNDLGKSKSSTLFPKYLPFKLSDKHFSKIKELEYDKLGEIKEDIPLMYEDYIPKYFLLSKNNNAGNFSEIIRRMYELYIPSKEKSIKDFFNMLKIYIILVINIAPVDFGGVQPNNPPTPPYINLELLRRGKNDFINGGSYEVFEKILAISLEHVYKYEIYEKNENLFNFLVFLTNNRDNLIARRENEFNSVISKIDEIIEIIDKNNAATLIGNTVEMYKHKNIVPMLYEMSKEKQDRFNSLTNANNASSIIEKLKKEVKEKKKKEEERLQAEKKAREEEEKIAREKAEKDAIKIKELKEKIIEKINDTKDKKIGKKASDSLLQYNNDINSFNSFLIEKINSINDIVLLDHFSTDIGKDYLIYVYGAVARGGDVPGSIEFAQKNFTKYIEEHYKNKKGGGKKKRKKKTRRKKKSKKKKRKTRKRK